jgi:hypothetical protein
MGKPVKKGGVTDTKGKVAKTAQHKGGRGRDMLCPVHGLTLVPAILVRHNTGRLGKGYNKRYHGWICGALGVGNIQSNEKTHYLTKTFEEWPV